MLLGNATPRILNLPEDVATSSDAEDAIELAAIGGLEADPWQVLALERALSRREDQQWAANEVGIVVPRQNGKGSVLEIRELAGLFLFEEEEIVHSAHEFKTCNKHFARVQFLVQQSPFFMNRIKRILTGNGNQCIQLKASETIIAGPGKNFVKVGRAPQLNFVARTSGSGRGFSGDVIILDEAYNLPEQAMTALIPTMSARPNPQVWYTSSAVDKDAPGMEKGESLARIRHRAINKRDSERLCYMEWSVEEAKFKQKVQQSKSDGGTWRDVARSKKLWATTNPGLGYRVKEDIIKMELAQLTMRGFMVERLGIGNWPNVDEDVDGGVIPFSLWKTLRNDEYKHEDIVFAVDVSIDRKTSSIVAFSEDAAGVGHVEVVETRSGTSWVVPYLLERTEKHKPLAIGVDSKSPTASLIFDMERAGIRQPLNAKRPRRGDLILLTLPDMAMATGQFLDACHNEQLNYMWHPDLDSAIQGAILRKVGDVDVWGRRDTTCDVSPLTAGTIARWVFLTHKEALLRRSIQPMVAYI